MNTQLTTKQNGNTAVALPEDYIPVAGIENLSPDDFSIPVVKLVQTNTGIDHADELAGQWYRTDTGETSEWKGRGRHTTTWRELILLPTGGVLIDNPGMRELQLWSDDGNTLDATFADIEALARQCRFRDCRHDNEPGCAVQQALRDGSLSGERYKRYRKLQRELRYLAMQQDDNLRRQEHDKWRKIAKANRARTKMLKRQRG